jgi:hypothetical protein
MSIKKITGKRQCNAIFTWQAGYPIQIFMDYPKKEGLFPSPHHLDECVMPALNFQKKFVPAILSGEKSQTIRALRKDGRAPAKVGFELGLYTGMRTKQCALIKVVGCHTVNEILMAHDCATMFEILPNGQKKAKICSDLEEFSKQDGFNSYTQMWDFFKSRAGVTGVFKGWLIMWEDLQFKTREEAEAALAQHMADIPNPPKEA